MCATLPSDASTAEASTEYPQHACISESPPTPPPAISGPAPAAITAPCPQPPARGPRGGESGHARNYLPLRSDAQTVRDVRDPTLVQAHQVAEQDLVPAVEPTKFASGHGLGQAGSQMRDDRNMRSASWDGAGARGGGAVRRGPKQPEVCRVRLQHAPVRARGGAEWAEVLHALREWVNLQEPGVLAMLGVPHGRRAAVMAVTLGVPQSLPPPELKAFAAVGFVTQRGLSPMVIQVEGPRWRRWRCRGPREGHAHTPVPQSPRTLRASVRWGWAGAGPGIGLWD